MNLAERPPIRYVPWHTVVQSLRTAARFSTVATGSVCCAAMAREQYLEHLASVPLFAGCTTKELRDIAKATVELTLDQGKEFVTQGDVGRDAFIIVEGTAEVSRSGQTIATLGPGDCVGELALLDHGPRTATVVAATPLTVLVLGPREFSGLLDEVPTLNHKILAALASRVRELDSQNFG
jgi:CRP-like cAMP-binding protein